MKEPEWWPSRAQGPTSLLTGCAGSNADEETAAAVSSSPRSSSTPSPSVSARQVDPNGFPLPGRPDCAADAGADFVRATTSEGNGVVFLLIGTGTSGVVLAPVLAVAALRDAGVRKVVLGGASCGGALAMSGAHRCGRRWRRLVVRWRAVALAAERELRSAPLPDAGAAVETGQRECSNHLVLARLAAVASLTQ